MLLFWCSGKHCIFSALLDAILALQRQAVCVGMLGTQQEARYAQASCTALRSTQHPAPANPHLLLLSCHQLAHLQALPTGE